MSSTEDTTKILADLRAGKKGASDRLLALVYDELHALAERYMRPERKDHTLQPTALVHEAYLRFGGDKHASWNDRAHFMRVAARAMQRVLTDYAKSRGSEKREGGWRKIYLDDITVFFEGVPAELTVLGDALSRLSEVDPQMVQIIELRFFAGFTVEETAKIMGLSRSTVNREWKTAKAWLKKEIGRGHDRPS